MTTKKIAYNPYLPGYEYIPDGEPYVFGDRLYVYGSHDRANGETYCSEDYVCWSAPINDLSDWHYEGVIYRKDQDPDNVEMMQPLYAPDVTQGIDGKYYLYYSIRGSNFISVAVCDTPAGQYDYHGVVHYADGSRMMDGNPFDPAVINDDGRIWLYSGFCPHFEIPNVEIPVTEGGMCIELDTDMLTCKSKPTAVIPNFSNSDGTGFEGHGYFEAPSIRKVKDTYYLVYASQQINELCYATSQYPNKDFKFGGTLICNGDIGYQGITPETARNVTANIHGGMVEIFGQWYIFYHRHTHGIQFSRQGCAEPITIHADGSIPQVEVTSCGLNGGVMPGKGETSALYACNVYAGDGGKALGFGEVNYDDPFVTENHEHEPETERTQYITNIADTSVIGFKYFLFDGTEHTLTLSVRGQAEGEIFAYLDDAHERSLGKIAVSLNAQNWETLSLVFESIGGKYPLMLMYRGAGTLELLSISIV